MFAVLPVCAFLFMQSHGVSGGKEVESARRFVQGFYDWYTPRANLDVEGRASDWALRWRGSDFNPRLRKALEEDSAAQDKEQGYIVGIDWDPFLGGQDPLDKYLAGKVRVRGGLYRVDVYGVWKGRKSEKPAMVAELEKVKGRWRFVDFLWPDSDDGLLHSLKLLKEDRAKHGSK